MTNDIKGTIYTYNSDTQNIIDELAQRVCKLRETGKLTPEVLHRLRQYFKLKNIYNSNAIEGNSLDIGETRQVIEQGLTITGKPLKDQAEAKNLAAAVDYLEKLAIETQNPILEFDVKQIHTLILKDIDVENAGAYRKTDVSISGSKYRPPSPEHISEQMHGFGEWLKTASVVSTNVSLSDSLINAAVAHSWLVYIHPFIDGNGRVARLLMNLLLMRCGFPIAIITREDRYRYYDALEFSQTSDLTPFITLLSECVEESLEEYEAAATEQREREEWAKSVVGKFEKQELIKIQNYYEIWKSAMDLFKSYMKQTVALISSPLAKVYFSDFGTLEFEKYLSLRTKISAKKTWFFRLDFRRGESKERIRYLFFFGYRSYQLKEKCHVTLHISREEPPGSFNYMRLSEINASNVPSIVEIGYDTKTEQFVARKKNDNVVLGKIEDFGKKLFEEIINFHFSS